jgi:hypothetical protein
MRPDVTLAGPEEVRTHQDDVSIEHGHARIRNLEIEDPAVSEVARQRARIGAQRDELSQTGEEDARRHAACPERSRGVARPVGDATKRRESFGQLVAPDFFAGFGLERDDAITRGEIHHAIDDDRHDLLKQFERAGRLVNREHGSARLGAESIGPRADERRDVRCVDLVEARVARAGEIAVVGWPVCIGDAPVVARLCVDERDECAEQHAHYPIHDDTACDAHASTPLSRLPQARVSIQENNPSAPSRRSYNR